LTPYQKEVSPLSEHPLEEILHPESIAIVGASGNPGTWGYSYTHHLLDYGFRGKIYPVNPRYSDVLGIKAYPTLEEVPGTVDYVISCVPSTEVPNMLDECSRKGVKAVHLYTARFSETGRPDAARLEQEILEQARRFNIRLIGPNCMGLYYPAQGISFGYDLPKEPGTVGMASQTGGGASGFVYVASMRGLRFSKVISYGNAIDFNESDYLDYFAQDPETGIILVYIEGVKDGRRFFSTLSRAASLKPVIVVKGGRGGSGTRAVASHTASIAGSRQTWESLISQAGAIYAQDFDELADLAVSFYFLPPVRGPRVGIVGGGGGPSVLSADQCEEAGLNVIPLPVQIRQELKSNGVPIWDWVGNPTDVSILGGFGLSDIDMLYMMGMNPEFDLLIANVNEAVMVTLSREEGMTLRFKSAVEGYTRIRKESAKPLLAIIGEKSPGLNDYQHWSWKLIHEVRARLIEAGIPFYPSVGRAARAARKMLDYYQRRK
jgi:acetyltransferase